MEKEFRKSIIKSRVSWAAAILLAVIATITAVLPLFSWYSILLKGNLRC